MWMMTALGGTGTVDLGLGMANLQMKDVHQSPIPQVSSGVEVRLGGSMMVRKSQAFVTLRGRVGSSRAAGFDRPIDGSLWVDLRAGVGALAPLIVRDKTTLRLGGSMRKDFELIDGLADHLWGLGVWSGAVDVEATRRLSNMEVAFGLTVPVVGFVTRHNYSLDPVSADQGDVVAFYAQGTRFETVGSFLDVRARIHLSIPMGRHRWKTRLSGQWFGYGQPQPIRQLQLSVTTGPTFVLGGGA